jgi:hypothetical protein
MTEKGVFKRSTARIGVLVPFLPMQEQELAPTLNKDDISSNPQNIPPARMRETTSLAQDMRQAKSRAL